MFYKDKASIEIICISLNKEPRDSEQHTSAMNIIVMEVFRQNESKENVRAKCLY